MSDCDGTFWIYRRDRTVQVHWDEAVLTSERGIPYLAPDIQLLFKSRNVRQKDNQDAAVVVPELTDAQRVRLRDLLPEDHPRQVLLAA